MQAEGQNIARRLMETPANILTPTNFAQVNEKHTDVISSSEVFIFPIVFCFHSHSYTILIVIIIISDNSKDMVIVVMIDINTKK